MGKDCLSHYLALAIVETNGRASNDGQARGIGCEVDALNHPSVRQVTLNRIVSVVYGLDRTVVGHSLFVQQLVECILYNFLLVHLVSEDLDTMVKCL